MRQSSITFVEEELMRPYAFQNLNIGSCSVKCDELEQVRMPILD